jgi:excisionase family DNA binding protein
MALCVVEDARGLGTVETLSSELLTLPEAARLLRVSTAHVRRMVDAGVCPAVTVSPRCRRIPVAHVRSLLAAAGVSLTLTAGAHA